MTIENDISSIGGNAQIILPAVSNTYYILQRIIYSYSSSISLGAGTLTIELGSTTVISLNLENSLYDIDNLNIQSDPDETVTITLGGIALLTAKLNIFYDTYTT